MYLPLVHVCSKGTDLAVCTQPIALYNVDACGCSNVLYLLGRMPRQLIFMAKLSVATVWEWRLVESGVYYHIALAGHSHVLNLCGSSLGTRTRHARAGLLELLGAACTRERRLSSNTVGGVASIR